MRSVDFNCTQKE